MEETRQKTKGDTVTPTTKSSDPEADGKDKQLGTGSMIFFSQMDAKMTNAWVRAIRG